MRIYWNDGTHIKVQERNLTVCKAFNNYAFYATTVDHINLICFYRNIKFIELPTA